MGLAKDIVKDNKKILLLTLGLFLILVLGAFTLNGDFFSTGSNIVQTGPYTQPEEVLQEGVDYKAIIRTEYGDIEVDLYEDQAPNAVNSFVFLSIEDFYNGLTFHRVIEDLVIQAGDQVGDGEGNPGYTLQPDQNQLEVTEYTMCMVNGSQFFIATKGADLALLEEFPVVGRVIDGFSVVDVIEEVPVGEQYKPENDVTINSILIIED